MRPAEVRTQRHLAECIADTESPSAARKSAVSFGAEADSNQLAYIARFLVGLLVSGIKSRINRCILAHDLVRDLLSTMHWGWLPSQEWGPSQFIK
jgi:hypothetical protein